MPTSFAIIKGALRSYSDGDHIHALLELKTLIERERDCWTAYLVRGKVQAAMSRHREAITDFNLVLQMSENLNLRNRRYVTQSIALCAAKLAERQRNDLGSYFARGAPPRIKKRGIGTRVIGTSNKGKIASIGKFLMDTQDIRRIERLVQGLDLDDSHIHTLSLKTGQAYCELLEKIGRQPGVVGSCLIGRDFFIRAHTLPDDYDTESFAINALAVYLSAGDSDKLKEFHKGGQVVVGTDLGYLIMLEFGELILITLSDEKAVLPLIKLASKIAKLVR